MSSGSCDLIYDTIYRAEDVGRYRIILKQNVSVWEKNKVSPNRMGTDKISLMRLQLPFTYTIALLCQLT